jgi:hypothetical protein
MTYVALLLVLAVLVGGVVFWTLGLRGRWAAWPWIVGWGFAAIPAVLMTFVKLCDSAAGTCPPADRIDRYQGALPSLIILAVAAASLLVPNRAVRAVAFPVLTLVGMVLVTLRLLDDGQRLVPVALIAIGVLGILAEVGERGGIRAAARTSAG